MPLTPRDAAQVTRDLGIHYLWIDALCILQDSDGDWHHESVRMANIYGNSFVTIFATGAWNCQGGLAKPISCTLPAAYVTPGRSVASWTAMIYKWQYGHDSPEIDFTDEPLNARAVSDFWIYVFLYRPYSSIELSALAGFMS
ncbi:hypothetical protein F5Y19DRAFT_82086 [Xylariaceae sp. FL1651]|nr:hypothetical protein F5Y19DRAFT_82086 [Xylariaceae sp. FL1651]